LKARSKYSAWCLLSYSIYETVAADGTYTCIKDLKIPNNETDDTEINNNCLSYVEDSNNNSENDSDDEK